MSFLEFVEGPMWYFAAAIFVLGAAWRIVVLLRFGRKTDLSVAHGSASAGFVKANIRHFVPRTSFAFRTWVHLVGGYTFHIGLFALVMFAAPHVKFFDERIFGFGWPALPRWGFILAAEFAFAGLILLWIRRICDPVMRQIADADDHVGTWLTFLVMLTGCLALQESHEMLRAIHMLLVNIWLIYFPFSRLMHAFTFVLTRGFTGAIYGRRGVTP